MTARNPATPNGGAGGKCATCGKPISLRNYGTTATWFHDLGEQFEFRYQRSCGWATGIGEARPTCH